MESFGIFTVYKTGTKRRKVNKIDFHKFIWVFWKKKNEYIFGVFFSSSRYEKKKIWTVLQFLNMNRLDLVKFWTIIPVFHEGKS